MDQLMAIYMEHGPESMARALYVVENTAQTIIEMEGGDFEDFLALTGSPRSRPESQPEKIVTMADKKAAKRAAHKERRKILAAKIKAVHNIVIDASKYSFKALNIILRTGEMQEQMKPHCLSNYMRFLQHARAENKKSDTPIASRELVCLVGEKWRAMSSEEKEAWKGSEVQKSFPGMFNVSDIEEYVKTKKPTATEEQDDFLKMFSLSDSEDEEDN